MKISHIFAATLILALATCLSIAQKKERDAADEQPILQELQKVAPKAVETFKSATLNLDSEKYDDAIRQFNEVLKQAPKFEPAMRRLGYTLVATGKRAEGVAMVQKAVDLNRTADNVMGMAVALVSEGTDGHEPTESEIKKALSFAVESSKIKGTPHEETLLMIAQLSLVAKNIDEFNRATTSLHQNFPGSVGEHYFYGLKLLNDGDLDAGTAELKKAEAMGLPHEEVSGILAEVEKAQDEAVFGLGAYFKYAYIVGIVIGAWMVGLVLLFVIGKILSKQTLDSIENSDPNDITGGGQAGLRSFYRKLITFAGVYYYISQPVVMLLVVGFTGGVILFFFWVGTIPIKLLLIVAFVGVATLFFMVKSLLSRTKIEDPGRVLTEQEAPRFWALVRDVATAINTRPVNEIRLTEGSELAVYERGGFRAKVNDNAERILIVGVATLNDFKQSAFRAVLAHEYGHFSNRDTAGGDVALRVNLDIIRLAESMGNSGTATFYNLAFQFIRLYHFLFRRITHGATRLQEILADRVAVYHFGAAAFRDGLTHVVRRDIEFDHVANKEISAALSANRAFNNLYDLNETEESALRDLDKTVNEVMNRPTTDDDTHPSPVDRFKLAEKITSKDVSDIRGLVWDLFENKNAITSELNSAVELRVRGKRYFSSHDVLT